MNKGMIVEIIGPVLDVEFKDELPGIYNALEVDVETDQGQISLVAAVQQHLGDGKVLLDFCDQGDLTLIGLYILLQGIIDPGQLVLELNVQHRSDDLYNHSLVHRLRFPPSFWKKDYVRFPRY